MNNSRVHPDSNSAKSSEDGEIGRGQEGTVEVSRGQWGSPVEFILSCLGYAVGLGNVWRFPYLCYENGGGAFLIPYLIMIVFVGLPIFLIELAIGQYSGVGPLNIWSISPIFKGVGAGMIMITFLVSIYYNMILAWSLYYMFASWQSQVPWYDCKNSWNTPYCYTKREAVECEESGDANIWFNLTCYNATRVAQFDTLAFKCNFTTTTTTSSTTTTTATTTTTTSNNDATLQTLTTENYSNDSVCGYVTENWLNEMVRSRVSAGEEYFQYRVLNRSSSIEESGEVQWELVLVLLMAWIICCLGVIRGIKSSGKVVYVTATFPYVVLIVLLIRGVLLPGALEGIKYYIIPEWKKLSSPKVWADAAGQVFFSLSVGQGGLMTFASYNPFHNNIYRDTLLVVGLDAFTSIFAGFAIFSIIGHLAHTLGRKVSEVARSGSGLAFVAYPEVVTYLNPPQLWSTLFFLMLITLGIDTQFAAIETLVTAAVDSFPHMRSKKAIITAFVCSCNFLLGLTMCTRSGVYWLDLMSYYSSGWSLIIFGLIEAIIFPWIYGADRLTDDIQLMVGFRLRRHWSFCWKFVSPLLLSAILVFNVSDFTPLAFGDYVLPQWSQAVGWLMAVVSVGLIPSFAVYQIWASYSLEPFKGLDFFRRIKKLAQPNEDWKPATDSSASHLTLTEINAQTADFIPCSENAVKSNTDEH